MIVLGVDGMDPAFVERHWDVLPNLRELRDEGSFARLQTTSPPQSPVAWSTFITGLTPDAHGIFDFVHRDAATLAPFSSMSETLEPRFTLPLGEWRIPLSSARIVSRRHGIAFWKLLDDAGVPVTMMRMPTNYPPVEAGHAVAGMGTPDLRGTQGTFSFYTDDPEELSRATAGGRIEKVAVAGGRAVLRVEGPPNSFRKDSAYAAVDVVADVDPAQDWVRFAVGESVVVLRAGEWSEWLTADFPLLPYVVSARGMFRIFVRQLHPRFEVYVTPVNVDPIKPVLPLSHPASFAKDLAEATGRFYTLGIPEDTSALRQGVFSLPQFLAQAGLVLADEKKLLRRALAEYRGGLLFFYLSSIDQHSHMLWGRHEAELLSVYREVDGMVGEVRRLSPGAELIVMSDHGFSTYERSVHLNRWLVNRGFLSLSAAGGQELSLSDANWGSTEAYALGLNGLYVNVAGREKNGSVKGVERRRAVIETLREQLLAFRDPETGARVVETVAVTNADAATASVAPDIIVGYAVGYRGSWETALGGVPRLEVEANNDLWVGDHCIDPGAVPGVLFSTRRLAATGPRLQDVTVSILQGFHVQPAAGMSGRALFP
ncbi:MAG: alkaline phosphatase family protein [Bryobacteraceae bacterium]